MRHFSDFITDFSSLNLLVEKLKISGSSKVNDINDTSGARDLSNVKIPSALEQDMYTKSPAEEKRHMDKMEGYMKKGSKPDRLLNSIKDRKKLVYRWYMTISMGWNECEKVFKKGIIDRGYYTADELDAYVLKRYKLHSRYISQENYEKYFEDYNIKYK